jgi:hypothetical protein
MTASRRKTAKVDLAKDQQKIRRYILDRIKNYAHQANDGPGDPDAAIRMLTMGYYLDQTGYFALVFDTRPDAENDGEWTSHIENETNVLGFPAWPALVAAWCEGKPAELVLTDGTALQLTQQTHNQEALVGVFGEMLRDTLLALRDEGALTPLPLADDAFLLIEEFDGNWGWPARGKKNRVRLKLDAPADEEEEDDEDGEDDQEAEEERKAELTRRIAKLPVEEQIAFWIAQLDRRGRGEPSELDQVFLDTGFRSWADDFALDAVKQIGKQAVVPLLERVRELAKLPEWGGDRPKRELEEMPVQNVAIGAIWIARDLKHATPEVEALLQQIVRSACETNAERKLWGILPYHAARCLHTLFRKRYPEPEWDGNTNRLLTPERFQSNPK